MGCGLKGVTPLEWDRPVRGAEASILERLSLSTCQKRVNHALRVTNGGREKCLWGESETERSPLSDTEPRILASRLPAYDRARIIPRSP